MSISIIAFLVSDQGFIYELVIDAWPIPYSWIVHGIWPGYVKGDAIVYYVPTDMDAHSYGILKEAVKKVVSNIHDCIVCHVKDFACAM